MNTENSHSHGFLFEPPVPGKDYVFGGYTKLKGEVLQADGQWVDYLPEFERQYRNGFETNACVSYGTINAIEILTKRIFVKEVNLSDRFVAKRSDTDPYSGNTPQKVAQTIREWWSVFEEEYPFDKSIKTVADFYKELPHNLKLLALGRGAEYSFTYDYVPPSEKNLIDALRYSPLGVSVNLALRDGDIYSKPEGWRDGHWVVLIGYEYGKHWWILDSYEPFLKKVAWDNHFEVAYRYGIDRQIVNEAPWQKFITWLKTLWI